MNIMNQMFAGAAGKYRYWLIGILGLAFFLRLVVLFGFTDFTSSYSEDPYPQMATYMLDGQGISKYVENKGVEPVTSHGPLYPLLSAAILLVSGRSWLVVRLAQLLLSVATVLMVFHSGRRSLGMKAGLLAAALTSVYLPLVRLSADLMTETLFTFILIMVVYLGMRFIQEWTGILAVWLGVFLGLLILTKLKGAFIAIAFLPLLMVVGYKRRRSLFWALVPFVLAIVIYSPWVVRNSAIEHTFLPFGTGVGESVLEGQDQSDRVISDPSLVNATAGQRSQGLLREAISFIISRPGEFLVSSGNHFMRMWFNLGFDEPPSAASIIFAVTNFFFLLAGAAGAVLLFRCAGPQRDLAYLIVTVLAVFTAVHLGTLGVGRYSVPLLPLVFLMVSWPLVRLFSRIPVKFDHGGGIATKVLGPS